MSGARLQDGEADRKQNGLSVGDVGREQREEKMAAWGDLRGGRKGGKQILPYEKGKKVKRNVKMKIVIRKIKHINIKCVHLT